MILLFSCKTRPGGTPSDGLYGEAPPERGTLFRHQVKGRMSLVELYERVEESVIALSQRT